jgi:hypothetical protein
MSGEDKKMQRHVAILSKDVVKEKCHDGIAFSKEVVCFF